MGIFDYEVALDATNRKGFENLLHILNIFKNVIGCNKSTEEWRSLLYFLSNNECLKIKDLSINEMWYEYNKPKTLSITTSFSIYQNKPISC